MEEEKKQETETQAEFFDEYEDENENQQQIYTKAQKNHDLTRIKETEDIFEIIELTRVENADVRLKAAQQMCPCRVKGDIPEFYSRLFEMSSDSDSKIRYQILHNICDGSPSHYENQIVEVIERLNTDSDTHIRSAASKVLASYIRTGKWNVM